MLFWSLTRILSHPYRQTGHFLTSRSFNTWLKIGWTLHRRFAKCFSKMARSTILDWYWTVNTSALAVTITWLIIWPDTSPVIISGISSHVNLVCPLMFIFCYKLFISRPLAFRLFQIDPFASDLYKLNTKWRVRWQTDANQPYELLLLLLLFQIKTVHAIQRFSFAGHFFSVHKYSSIKQNIFSRKCYKRRCFGVQTSK